MISPKELFNELNEEGVSSFSGVPDSLLKSFCAFVSDNASNNHIITANEGSAIALATGQYLSTKKISCVYMQNSGFGNAINPLLSIASEEVYGIPMILIIGWRGEPGVKDEPQHIKQGAVMENLLNACEIPYFILDSETKNLKSFVSEVVQTAKLQNCPVVILVRKNTFSKYELKNNISSECNLKREEAIEEVVLSSIDTDVFVSTTGMTSRELFEIRVKHKQAHSQDFLTVGSMGHANMIAMGIAENNPNSSIICLDGDGAALMHLGNLSSIGQSCLGNFIHIVLNNAAHDSVGGQPTCADSIDLLSIASSCGYKSSIKIVSKEEIIPIIEKVKLLQGPHFIEIKVKKGSRDNLGRPTKTPSENKAALMDSLS